MSRDPAVLPPLSSDYPLGQDQIAAFQRDGHILLPHVCSTEEVRAYREVISDATYRYNTETRPMEERDTYGRAFLQIMNLWTRDEAARRYVLSRRFAKIAADLMGVDAVRLYHDQALYKEGGGGHTPWHQDHYYWPLKSKGIQALTMWMPLVDVPIDMGALTFASGSHNEGFLGHLEISDKSHDEFDRVVRSRGFPVVTAPMAAGDATFHASWLLHSAPGNSSPETREVMTIIYFADGVSTFEPDNEHRANDLRTWLPGVNPGEPAASELNPVVFRR
ncbi:MAG TPA: phytanoyl-CoA dioxygenase family protein [Chthonomonadaceae bacterium]|nr:phytanoyl-CoA dioxygenase family protein [Chthonomonadaceae bacterium]